MQLLNATEFLERYRKARAQLATTKLKWGEKFEHAHAISTVIEDYEMELIDKE